MSLVNHRHSTEQSKSDYLASSREMSARFQRICQRANAISEKLFYNASTLNQSLPCELAEEKGGSSFFSAQFIKFITPWIVVKPMMV